MRATRERPNINRGRGMLGEEGARMPCWETENFLSARKEVGRPSENLEIEGVR